MRGDSQLPKRSPAVGAVNALLPVAWATGALRRPIFDIGALKERARAITGLADFGDPWFEQPLQVLIEALEQEADLNPLGQQAAYGQFVKVLRDRLWTQHWFEKHPEILDRPIRSPVVVVGPMRSGTTRLQRLLAADDRFLHLRFFETVSPVPPPQFRRGARDPRAVEARRILSAARLANPRTAVIHPTGVYHPEEELGLLVASAWGLKHESQWSIPSYGAWSARQDATPAYLHLSNLLRLIEWLRDDGPGKRWVLKTPQHMLNLDALLNVFPDARIIFIHRDPTEIVGSTCSHVWNQTIIHSDRVNPHAIGQRWLEKIEQQINSAARTRQMTAGTAIDVTYEEMERNWQSVMARIYAFLDIDVAPALLAMEEYTRSAHQCHRSHRYSLQPFGLGTGIIRERFGGYISQFGLVADARSSGARNFDPIKRGKRHQSNVAQSLS